MSRAGPRKTPAELFRRCRKPRAKPEPHVVGDPQPGLVPQDWFEEIADLLPCDGAVVRRQWVQEILGKHVEPGAKPGRERRRPRHARDLLDRETGRFKLLLIRVGRGE